MREKLEAARERVAGIVERVQRAQARRDELRAESADAAALRGAEAELHLQREALEVAREELARIERQVKAQAQEVLDRELREMAARVLRDVDAVLAGALALRRSIGLGRARGLRTPSGSTLPAEAERLLESWRGRLRAVAGEAADDAA